jgi:hypothetical protein
VLVALRDTLRRREIYVRGAHRWRDPDDNLPGDFDTTREGHYAAIRRPTDSTALITGLRDRMTIALARLDTALVNELGNLAAVKDEVIRCWALSTCSTCSRTPTSSPSSAPSSPRSPPAR